jgi:hypothetical protein
LQRLAFLIRIVCINFIFDTVSKADVLVPPGLLIQNSTIPNAGHGVFANCEIPKHEFFGPYLGKIIEAKDAKNYQQSHYIWEVKFVCYSENMVPTGFV